MAVSLGRSSVVLGSERALATQVSALTRATERLSSGLRINRASDDAAGLAVATTLNAKTRVYTQAIRNANDGISALAIADGAGKELSGILIRLKELAESSANGPYSRIQRVSTDKEADSLVAEYNRIIGSSSFNNRKLLDPNGELLNLQLGFGSQELIGISLGSGIGKKIGTGSYGKQALINGGSIGIIAVGDFNGDGYEDVVSAANIGSTVTINLSNSQGVFSAGGSVSIGSTPINIQVGDFNRDGKQDVVLNTTTGTVRTLLGNGAGGFSNIASGVSLTNGKLITGDIDNDGILDISFATGSTVSVYKGIGDGTFNSSAVSSVNVGSTVWSLSVGDFSGDGKNEIYYGTATGAGVISNTSQNSVSLSISTTVSTGYLVDIIQGGDINHDGLMDLMLSHTGSNTKFATQNSNGTLTVGNATYSGDGKLIDYDRDGNLDLFNPQSMTYSLGNGDGTFQSSRNINGSGFSVINAGSTIFGDFNGDGVQDLGTIDDAFATYAYISETTRTANIARLDLTNVTGARNALDAIDSLLQNLSKELGNIGATQSRLGSALNSLFARADNFQAASSRIMDVDVADESANLTRRKILQQVAADILSTASLEPQTALQLIRG